MPNTYDKGSLVRVRGAFTSRALTDSELATFQSAGTLPASVGVTPTAVVFTVIDPALATTTPATTNPSTGSYYADVSAALVGVYSYQWKGTGTNQGADEGSFEVAASKF